MLESITTSGPLLLLDAEKDAEVSGKAADEESDGEGEDAVPDDQKDEGELVEGTVAVQLQGGVERGLVDSAAKFTALLRVQVTWVVFKFRGYTRTNQSQ